MPRICALCVIERGVRATDTLPDDEDALWKHLEVFHHIRVRMERGRTYAIYYSADAAGHRLFVCADCGSRSANPNDVQYLYCGVCHKFHKRSPVP